MLGGLVLVPAALGMPLLPMDQTALMSLMGHAIYGLVTTLALHGLTRREA
ncbi:hypothetical protein GCM10007147_21500 [Nocardiopsis kunsanensis]|uniref:Uncharacterized protein n=1 Tax=Nocardiopsis kunsanensis TaxID=141693 RepID=A0A918XBG6_9ACTN|nr:hypothetical protein GCM10007147_21500 [Nocardiopsis kunsanensis]